ncbi:WD-40 repeat protein, partial [Reticulomyxa filosa]
DNEKSKEIQQLKQYHSAFEIRIIKLEEILKSNNDGQFKQIAKLNNNPNIEFEKFKKDIQLKNQINEDKKENDHNNQLSQSKYNQSHTMVKENEIQIIIQHWIRISNIKLGWINNFNKLVANYVTFLLFFKQIYLFFLSLLLTQAATFFTFDTFCSSSKLINTFTGHANSVCSVDYSTFDDCQFICSGSYDRTVRAWDVDNNKQIQSFNKHSNT